jgi:hypothetical protein
MNIVKLRVENESSYLSKFLFEFYAVEELAISCKPLKVSRQYSPM